MESEISRTVNRHKEQEESWRRRCGCLRTSEKLKQMLDAFPPPPPPPPTPNNTKDTKPADSGLGNTCISAFCTLHQQSSPNKTVKLCCDQLEVLNEEELPKKVNSKSWRILTELVQLVQVSVTATALALYYIIYCYMQLIYYTLRSALYFHNADGAMKITIAVVAITSFVVAINVILKIEKVIKIY